MRVQELQLIYRKSKWKESSEKYSKNVLAEELKCPVIVIVIVIVIVEHTIVVVMIYRLP